MPERVSAATSPGGCEVPQRRSGRTQRPPGGPSLLATSGVMEWQAVGEQVTEGLGHEVRRAEDVGHELTLAQGVEGRDIPALRAGLQLIDAAPLVDDEAEARGDVAAQALRPRLPPTVFQVIPNGSAEGGPLLPATSGVMGGRPSGNSSRNPAFTKSGAPRM